MALVVRREVSCLEYIPEVGMEDGGSSSEDWVKRGVFDQKGQEMLV